MSSPRTVSSSFRKKSGKLVDFFVATEPIRISVKLSETGLFFETFKLSHVENRAVLLNFVTVVMREQKKLFYLSLENV